MIEVARTPDERFADLPDFPYEPRYREVDGLRLAHLDEGEGPPVLLVHGEPTWSYLWRHAIPPLRDAGYRCIAPDHAGFGRSDKPTALDWYSYDRHTALAAELLERLDLRGATVVVHDWGGPIGLRLAVEHPERIDRIVVMDTGLFTGSPADERGVGGLPRLRRAHGGPADRHARARRLPSRPRRRGDRRLRGAVPRRRVEGRRARVPAADPAHARRAGRSGGPARARRARDRRAPEARAVGRRTTRSSRRRPAGASRRRSATELAHVVPDAGHFLQEDQGALIGRLIAEWLG